MHFQDKLFLSSYLIKAAGKSRLGAAIVKALAPPKPVLSPAEQVIKKRLANLSPKEKQLYADTQVGSAARKATPAAAPSGVPAQLPAPNLPGYTPPPVAFQGAAVPYSLPPPSFLGRPIPRQPILTNVPDAVPSRLPALAAVAPSVAGPQGLALARLGFGQLTSGLRQAAGSGANAARLRIGSGLSAAGRGISSTARNPLVQAGGVGLLGGVAGSYGMNRLMGGGVPAQQTPTVSTPTAVTPTPPPVARGAENTRVVTMGNSTAPAKSTALATSAVPATSTDAAAPSGGADSMTKARELFDTYMGSAFNPDSRVDINKLKFLQGLQDKGMDLEDVKGNYADVYKRMEGMKF